MSNWMYEAQQRLAREAPGFKLSFIFDGAKDFNAIGARNGATSKAVLIPCGPPSKQAVDEHLTALIELAKNA